MDNEQNLTNAVQIISAFGEKMETVQTKIEERLGAQRGDAAVAFQEEMGKQSFEYYYDSGGWVLSGWRWRYPAKNVGAGGGHDELAGELSIVADLWDKRRPSSQLGFPCMIIAWTVSDGTWDEIDGKRGATFWPYPADKVELRSNGRLFCYVEDGEDPDDEDSWRGAKAIMVLGSTFCPSPRSWTSPRSIH